MESPEASATPAQHDGDPATPDTDTPRATPALTARLAAMAGDIKVSHSVFAMPFALLATFLAASGFPGWAKLGLIVVCMVFARTFAMLANRYLDRDIDKHNPRTAGRALPSGRVRPRDMMIGMIVCGAGLVGGAAAFGYWGNWWPAMLSPAVLAWLAAYGLMKRFTALCHFFLGAALAISPLAAGLAIEPTSVTSGPVLWCLAGFVLLWVAGFDIIYAMQDIDVDQRDGLHSVPSKLGTTGALVAAKFAHVGALVALIGAYRMSSQLGTLFSIGIAIVGVLLMIEHVAARRGKFSMAFFTVNGVISLILGGLGIADVLIG
ncbi:MAG: 4-hydroxybenzoate octaprenyltransferase [Phycisphaera sp.]|nr:4-hydroxybenzoate octaprenyltransferase [Phycisphaera sp.]